MENQQQPIIITAPQNNSAANTAIKYVAGGLLLVGGIYFGKKAWDKYQHEKALREYANSPEAQQAVALYTAMNPSGSSFLSFGDGTNEEALYAAAQQIKDFPKVQEIYKKVYGINLVDDLQKELTPEELVKFNTIINDKKSDTGSGTRPASIPTFGKGQAVISKTDARIRKTPFITGTFSKTNVITTTKSTGVFVGYTTGVTKRDAASNTLFFEVQMTMKVNDLNYTIVNVWIAGSTVDVLKIAPSDAQKKYGKPMVFSQSAYNMASSALSGIALISESVVTKVDCYTLTNQMDRIKMVGPGVKLGQKISELIDANGNSLVQFKTAQGYDRWVSKNCVNII